MNIFLTSIFIFSFIYLSISSFTNLANNIEDINTSFTPTRGSITVLIVFMKNPEIKILLDKIEEIRHNHTVIRHLNKIVLFKCKN